MERQVVSIFVNFDWSYAPHATTMVRSLLDNSPPACRIDLYALGVGLSPEIKERVVASWPGDRLTVHWLSLNLQPFQRLFGGTDYPTVAYARLLLDWLLPDKVARVITLDCDGVFLGDVADLWQAAPTRVCVRAAVDLTVLQLGHDRSSFVQQLGGHEGAPYFNSGVMVVDLERWRSLDVTGECLKLVHRYPGQANYADQSILNAVLRDEWEPLPVRWNCNAFSLAECSYPSLRHRLVSMTDVRAARRHPGFVHFAGRQKPWNAGPSHPHARLYRDYEGRTGWASSSAAIESEGGPAVGFAG